MVNLRTQSATGSTPAKWSLSKTGQASLGISNIENLKAFYQDKEEGQHTLLSSYPSFGVNITINLPGHKKADQTDKLLRLRNAMILSQYQMPVEKMKI